MHTRGEGGNKADTVGASLLITAECNAVRPFPSRTLYADTPSSSNAATSNAEPEWHASRRAMPGPCVFPYWLTPAVSDASAARCCGSCC